MHEVVDCIAQMKPRALGPFRDWAVSADVRLHGNSGFQPQCTGKEVAIAKQRRSIFVPVWGTVFVADESGIELPG